MTLKVPNASNHSIFRNTVYRPKIFIVLPKFYAKHETSARQNHWPLVLIRIETSADPKPFFGWGVTINSLIILAF
jgi:hypothetical protein